MLTRTPSSADLHVKDFCRSIVADASPVLLPITAGPDDEPLNCFGNVRKKVAEDGGRIVFGWAIWEWPRVYIDAEHHAVYESSQGDWIDVTPSEVSGIGSRVFFEDTSAIYDFENEGIRRDNHRLALKRDPLIEEFFNSARRAHDAMNALPGIGNIEISPEIARHLGQLQQAHAQLLVQLAMRYLGRNDRCFCESGRKLKACHGAER